MFNKGHINSRFLNGFRTGEWKNYGRYGKSRIYLYSTLVFGITTSYMIFRKKKSPEEILCEPPREIGNAKDRETIVDKLKYSELLNEKIDKSRDLIRRIKDEVGAPGIIVGVSVNGQSLWEEGFGFADVENRVPCSRDTVMRIASISKSITMTALAKLWEEGKVDFDKPVQEYVPAFPEKTYEGEKVTITCRHLVSHLSGIRHYDKEPPSENNKEKTSEKKNEGDAGKKEYELKDTFPNIQSALNLFKDDPLFHKPGSKYLYTTHGWTLVSAIVENATKELFTKHITQMFKSLGMQHTYLDVNDKLIYNRSRYYCKDKQGRLVNSPYVDNSYKWAGGGFLSTIEDLLKFGNLMLYSSQCNNKAKEIKSIKEGFLKPETLQMIWTPVPNTEDKDKSFTYGMGWVVVPGKNECGFCQNMPQHFHHTGGAIGASSILLILPRKCEKEDVLMCHWMDPPKGVVVAIITNMQGVNLITTALEIARLFDTL